MAMTIGKSMRLRPVKVIIHTTNNMVIEGQLNLGTKDRLSDVFINSTEQFLVILKATVNDDAKEVMILNRNFIAWVEPVAEDRDFKEHIYQKGAQKLSY